LTKSLSTIEALQGASNSASQLESELDRRAQELNQLRAELEQLRDANASLQKLVDEMKAEKVESLGNTLTSEETEKLRTALEERDKEIMKLRSCLDVTVESHRNIWVRLGESLNRVLPDLRLEGEWQ
jgi:chaperonin cofactor prefoldin